MKKSCNNCAGKAPTSCYACFKANKLINWKPSFDYIPDSRADKIRKMSNEEMAVDLMKMFEELSKHTPISNELILTLLNAEMED